MCAEGSDDYTTPSTGSEVESAASTSTTSSGSPSRSVSTGETRTPSHGRPVAPGTETTDSTEGPTPLSPVYSAAKPMRVLIRAKVIHDRDHED
jgi:hypothetical protein